MKRILLILLALCLLISALPSNAEELAAEEMPGEAAAEAPGEVTFLDPNRPVAPQPSRTEAPEEVVVAPEAAANAASAPQVLEVKVKDPVFSGDSWLYPYPCIMQKEATKFTVRTNTRVRYLTLLNARGKKLKTWSYKKNAKTRKSGGVKYRVWTVPYTFKKVDLVTVSFAGAWEKSKAPKNGVSISFEVLEAPVIRSVKVTPKTVDVGRNVSFTLKGNDACSLLEVYDASGKPLAVDNLLHTSEGDAQTITGTFALAKPGKQKVTFLCRYNEGHGVARKKVTLTARDSAIHSAKFLSKKPFAGDAVKASVVTGTAVKVLGLFNERQELIDHWSDGQYYTDKNGKRTWTVPVTLHRIGKRGLTFRTRTSPLTRYPDNPVMEFGPGTPAPVTVVGKDVVDVSSVYAGVGKLNGSGWFDMSFYKRMVDGHRVARNDWFLAGVDMLVIFVGAPENTKYIHLYDKNGNQLHRIPVDASTMQYEELEMQRQWYIPLYLTRSSPDNQYTVKASVDGTTVGKGKTFTITCVQPVPIAPGRDAVTDIVPNNYPEECSSALAFTAPESRAYTFRFNNSFFVDYLLYRAGSDAVLDAGTSTKTGNNQTEVTIRAQAGTDYVLRVHMADCRGLLSVPVSCF